ncbi:MAG: hypothetical protein ACTHQ3_12755 [Motilibacteraceae bacterium]
MPAIDGRRQVSGGGPGVDVVVPEVAAVLEALAGMRVLVVDDETREALVRTAAVTAARTALAGLVDAAAVGLVDVLERIGGGDVSAAALEALVAAQGRAWAVQRAAEVLPQLAVPPCLPAAVRAAHLRCSNRVPLLEQPGPDASAEECAAWARWWSLMSEHASELDALEDAAAMADRGVGVLEALLAADRFLADVVPELRAAAHAARAAREQAMGAA